MTANITAKADASASTMSRAVDWLRQGAATSTFAAASAAAAATAAAAASAPTSDAAASAPAVSWGPEALRIGWLKTCSLTIQACRKTLA